MGACRCPILNVLTGEVARDHLTSHLAHSRVDGMGRPVHRCEDTGIEWIEERHSNGYAGETIVLRRVAR